MNTRYLHHVPAVLADSTYQNLLGLWTFKFMMYADDGFGNQVETNYDTLMHYLMTMEQM